MILAIDPSSTRSGYAVLTNEERILERGILKPTRAKDAPHTRIDTMLVELVHIRDDFPHIQDVVIEDTDGKVGGRHGGRGAGLAIYGMAVRAFRDQCRRLWGDEHVHMVLANEWTRGRRKSARAAALGLTAEGDAGLDAADAVGLGLYWLGRQTMTAKSR